MASAKMGMACSPIIMSVSLLHIDHTGRRPCCVPKSMRLCAMSPTRSGQMSVKRGWEARKVSQSEKVE